MRAFLVLALFCVLGAAALPVAAAHPESEFCDEPLCIRCTYGAVRDLLARQPVHDCIWT